MKRGGHLISSAVMVMIMVLGSTAYGEIYLYANGQDVESIQLALYEPCTFEIVSNDYTPYYMAWVGWDWSDFGSSPMLGTFTLSEIMFGWAGDMAEAYLYDDPGLVYVYEVVATGYDFLPEPGIHFVFDYIPDQPGETDLLLIDEFYSYIIDSIYIYVGGGPIEDQSPPSPDPMTWASPPDAAGIDSVTMTATTASDENSVEYYFQCVSGGGNDSDWQSDTTYVDTSLQPGTTYTYKVKARDLSGNLNETAYSASAGATTDSGVEPPSGLEGSPFQINTPAQMDEIGQHSEDWGSYFILTADIDLSGYDGQGGNPAFNIIGNNTTKFTGSFDGNGHTISNFTYTSTGIDYIALFGYVGIGGEIKDLGLTNVNVDAGTGGRYVGSLVGFNNEGTVSNCQATGSVTGDWHVGGLVGQNNGTVSNCYATGSVSGTSYVGGLVGLNYGTVSNCYATGSVSGINYVGGLVGANNGGTVSNCYAASSVGGDYGVGGLIAHNNGTVSNCYATGAVSGTNYVGGLVGYHYSGPYTSCFWDSDVNSGLTGVGNITDPAEVMGRTTAQMQTENTFTDYGWDFVNIWRIDEGVSYPYLQWQLKFYYVDDDAPGPVHDGTSWGTAFRYLQDALTAASSGDEIWVAAGIYKPDQGGGKTPGDRTATFQLKNQVSVYGGYAGYGTPDPNARDIETYETRLSGDLSGNDEPNFINNDENSYHVIVGNNTDETAILDGFTISGGNANGSSTYGRGGGMYNEVGHPTVVNCTFSSNLAYYGGGMNNRDGSYPIIINCTFSDNKAEQNGGGMQGFNSGPILTNCTFSRNFAGWNGGGINNHNFNDSSTAILTNCLFNANLANNRGGGVYNFRCQSRLTNCTIAANAAGNYGGGMASQESSPTATNCIFWDNQDVDSTGQRGQIYNDGSTSLTINYSCVQGWTGSMGGIGNVGASPDFVDADGVDGIFGTEDDDLGLSPGSACIDAGDSTSIPADTDDIDGDGDPNEPVPFDLDGKNRLVDDPYTIDTGVAASPVVDMGAYETRTAYFVDANSPADDADGSSWDNAFIYLQDALAAAEYGQEIWVAQGTYYPDEDQDGNVIPGNRSETFQLINGVKTYGGFTPGDDWADRDAGMYETLLSGDLNGNDGPNFTNNNDNSYHVVTGSGTDPNTVIDGFTISGGNTNGNGGGLLNEYGDPTVTNCTITANKAGMFGGGVSNYNSNPIIRNCRILSSLGYLGGGIYNQSSSPTIENCTLNSNSAWLYGGGMYNEYDSSPTLTNSILWGNSDNSGTDENAQIDGGGSPVVNYSCIQGWTGSLGGTGNIGSDPNFVDADGADNIAGTSDDDVHLLSDSPCIDTGYPGSDYNNEPQPNGNRINRGAYGNTDEASISSLDFDEDGIADPWEIYWGLNPDSDDTDGDGLSDYLEVCYDGDCGSYNPYDPGTGQGGDLNADSDDTDGDAMPDVWEVRYSDVVSGIDETDADEDPDEDGFSNIEEFFHYSEPNNINSVPHPIIFYVDADATGANDGSSWANAFTELKNVLLGVISYDKILVAEGTYKPAGFGGERAATFQLKNQVTVYGGYAGYGTPNPNARDIETYETILSGDLNGDDRPDFANNGENSYHVVTGSGTNETAILDGFTITAGNANVGTWPDYSSSGGGMFNYSGSPTVTNCTFSGNSAVLGNGGGGGMYNWENSSPMVTNCTFSGNSADWGGGMENDVYSSPTVTNCTFTGNSAVKDKAGHGGGMCNWATSSPMVTNCTFSSNSADVKGGGMANQIKSSPTITNCLFTNNDAEDGGGMFNSDRSNPTITNCTFSGNSADGVFGGGAIFNYQGAIAILNSSRFVSNTSSMHGGAICNMDRGTATITGCTFTFNSADEAGGAIYGDNSKYFIANSSDEFSSTQGQDNWYYGYYDGDPQEPYLNPDFEEMSAYNGTEWSVDRELYWTAIWEDGGHPQKNPEHWAVRRWVSEITGPVTVMGNLGKIDGSCGDGIMGYILIDGVVVWSQYIAYNDTIGVDYSIDVDVTIGSLLDFAIAPIANSNCDGSRFTAYIEPLSPTEYPTVSHSILWNNIARDGSQIALNDSTIEINHTDIDGDMELIYNDSSTINWSVGNININPDLTPNGHLRAGSPCIDTGDPAFITDPNAPVDIDGEDRILGGQVDIGADEFLDTDADGLPDWWENEYFGSATGAIAGADPDSDGLTNLQEYDIYSSDPNATPIYVDDDATGDPEPGDPDISDPAEDGTAGHPFDAIREGINAAADGDTVVVLRGTYTGVGNRNMNFGGKAIVVYGRSGSEFTTINCQSSGRAFVFNSGETSASAVVGFTIINGQLAKGGAILCDHSHPQIRNCSFTDNAATLRGNSLYFNMSYPVLVECTITGNDPNDDAIFTTYGGTEIVGDVTIMSTRWDGHDVTLSGRGTVHMQNDATINLNDSRILCNLSGILTLEVDITAELILEASIDLQGDGVIESEGLLTIREDAEIINGTINVTQVSFEDDVTVSNCIINVDSSAPIGQFFIEEGVTFSNNEIHAEGDRYMDIDPEALPEVIQNNKIYITITDGVGSDRGGLLELRGLDIFCTSPPCEGGIYHQKVPDYDPNTWTIEQLELIDGAKVNLTNRQDYHSPYDSGGANEVMYVKNLILGENSVLNTSFNLLYYDANDIAETAVITNEPMLGFSLINIAFDDKTEYLVRVTHNSFIHPEDPNHNRPHVERVVGELPDLNGMMRMTNLLDTDLASATHNDVINARAQGLFSKVSEGQVLVLFDYLFESPGGQLDIYLSDVPEMLALNDPLRQSHYVYVGTVPHPPAGAPGSLDSDCFGTFEAVVPKGDLVFIKGTRMELELVGPEDTTVLINDWDPWIECSEQYCMDVTGDDGVTVVDFLTILGEYGQPSSASSSNNTNDEEQTLRCLDGVFSDDGYIGMGDLMVWDWLDSQSPLGNYCFDIPMTQGAIAGTGMDAATSGSGLEGFSGDILIAGKEYNASAPTYGQSYLTDRLYGFDEDGGFTSGPFAMGSDRLNSRVIRDHDSNFYQLNMLRGLVRISDSNSIVPPGIVPYASDPRYSAAVDVIIGLSGSDTNWLGRPIVDAAFDADGFVYIAPVVVDPNGNGPPYTAVVKLQLQEENDPPYQVVQMYDDPTAVNTVDGTNPSLDCLREIELDENGYLYVVNSHDLNQSDILWVYDTTSLDSNPVHSFRVDMGNPAGSVYLPAPVGMHVSNAGHMLYMGSSLNTPDDTSVELKGLSTDDFTTITRTVTISNMGHITDITEDPVTGTIWAVGFKMTTIPPEISLPSGPFYEPYLAKIPYNSSAVTAVAISSGGVNDLALPLSVVWTGIEVKCEGLDFDISGTVDYLDFAVFATHWKQLGCTPPDWCGGCDLDPYFGDRGQVDITDLRIFGEYWLSSDCLSP